MMGPKGWKVGAGRRGRRKTVALAAVTAAWGAGAAPAGCQAALERLAETPLPTDTAVRFAPGVVSVRGRYEYGVSFSPDQSELLFTAQPPNGPSSVYRLRLGPEGWDGPERLSLSGGARAQEMEAFFTPDGSRVYFAAFDAPRDVRIWAVDRVGPGRWVSPRPLGPPIADVPAFFPTATESGGLYWSNIRERTIYRATLRGDSVIALQATGWRAGHAFVAPDESYVLLDMRRADDSGADLYVSFRRGDGSWSEPVPLGPGVNTAHSETCPSMSPDGRYLFFSRYDEEGGVSDIYWVSASVLDEARRRAAIPGIPPAGSEGSRGIPG